MKKICRFCFKLFKPNELISLWKDIVENVNKWMTNCEDVYKWDLGQMGVTRCYKDESVCLDLNHDCMLLLS